MVEAMTDANRNEALLITDNRMIRNRFYGLAENGTGSITYAGFARNTGSGNRPSLLLQSAQQSGLRR